MKNLGLYKDNLSIPRKQDIDSFSKRVNDAEVQLTVLDSDISSIEGDIVKINGEIGKKLNAPTGTQGQLLGFTANNVVGAVNAPSGGVNIKVQSAQPVGLKTQDFWYQIV